MSGLDPKTATEAVIADALRRGDRHTHASKHGCVGCARKAANAVLGPLPLWLRREVEKILAAEADD